MSKKTLYVFLIAAAFLFGGLTACQPGEETLPQNGSQQVPSDEGSPTGAPQLTDIPAVNDAAAIQILWEASPHAQTYEVDDQGINSTCARCHAPINYVPSMDDLDPACAACKFEVEPPPPMIAESDWEHVSCNICHRVKKGEVDPEFAWLAIPPIDEYEELATTTDLCMKCHSPADIIDHTGITIAGDHAGYTCTQCHDPHSTVASCSTSVCHPDAAAPSAPIAGHDVDHAAVTCGACHDASGLDVRPDEEGSWLTYLPGSSTPVISHNIVKQAECERCHFSNNPWNLSTQVSSTAP